MKRPGDLQRAMWSLHSYAVRERLSGSTRFLRATPLGEALECLACERDEHRALRVRIAETCFAGPKANKKERDQTAESASAFIQAAKAQAGEPACKLVAGPVIPRFASPAQTVSFTMRSHVKRPFADLRKILDPRGWGHCSDFFDPERTYRVRTGDDDLPVRDKHGSCVRDDGEEVLGESWRGLLRERFDGPGVAVDNILAIDFRATDEVVKVGYALYGSESCTLGPLNDIGGLLKNSGTAVAKKNANGIVVDVTKILRFVDYTPGETGSFIDLGEALSMLMAVMGVALVNDKFVLRLCCNPNKIKLQTKRSR